MRFHILHDAPWDVAALNARRLECWRAHPTLRPHGRGVLIVHETGDRKRGHGIPFASQQYIGKVGFAANGVVSVTSHWTDGTRHVPLGVRPYRPASRLPEGKQDRQFRTKPDLAWELVEEAWRTGIPFRAVVADCVYGEHPTFTANLFCADIVNLRLKVHRWFTAKVHTAFAAKVHRWRSVKARLVSPVAAL